MDEFSLRSQYGKRRRPCDVDATRASGHKTLPHNARGDASCVQGRSLTDRAWTARETQRPPQKSKIPGRKNMGGAGGSASRLQFC